ncbi:heterogeneous nuclear ribonucleoprotein L isoform X17 [Drosophila pseudoobscura]|uniref:Heterogeneous nuclear ribonucleoprotein L isoform X17 n=1 Tax=Drosophila pseudoobscura pseudoobscura TaxID=46245 RepID=A0A6I8V6K3_DROPS|nr:heterogeneous nuclear ribonucleoprotein L isoform X17 [Drosophila pseudoobscura]
MNNLNANATAFLWQSAQPQQQSQPLPGQPLQQTLQQPQHAQLVHGAVVPQPRKFGGNKGNYNYVQTHIAATALMGGGGGGVGAGTGGGHMGPTPIAYRKRQPMNQAFNGCGFQSNEPPLLGPGAAFPPFGAPEYHPTTPDNWKGASIHPTGLMKEPTGVVPGRNAPVAFTPQGQAQGAVMMVYGLDHDTSNTDKLFNLVCLYGNVARIKFLKTKEGTAMVQMGDSVAVERCVQHLNNIPVGTGGKIQIAFSKQNFLSEVINPFLLPDHTPSFKEYTGSKNNRFLSPAQASKNRIQPPSKILHFFNTPPGLTEDQLIGIFNIKDVPATSVRLFPLKTERSSSGLIEFPNISQAVLAIMKCNHLPIEGKGTKFPFIMKLCFSSSKSMNGAWNNATNEGMIEKENEVDSKVDIYN